MKYVTCHYNKNRYIQSLTHLLMARVHNGRLGPPDNLYYTGHQPNVHSQECPGR